MERKSRCFCFPYLSRQSHCCFGKNDKYNHTSLLTDKHKPRVGSLPREVRSLLGGGLAQVTLLLDAQKFFVGPKDTILNFGFIYDMDKDLGMVWSFVQVQYFISPYGASALMGLLSGDQNTRPFNASCTSATSDPGSLVNSKDTDICITATLSFW